MTDGGSLLVAQAVTAVQNWMAAMLAAVLATSVAGRRAQLPLAVLAGTFVLACFGVAGGFGTRGYADLLWAAAATSAALALLVLPIGRRTILLGGCCLAVAMLTKAEGLVTGFVVFLPLTAVRLVLHDRRTAVRHLLPIVGVVVGAAMWPILAAAYVPVPQRDVTAASLGALMTGDPDKVDRVGPAFNGLLGYTRFTLLSAGVVIAVGWVTQRRTRGRSGVGGPLWLPAAAAGCFTVSFVVLAAGELDVRWWVAAGGFRTMTVVRALLLAEVLVAAAMLLDEFLDRRTTSSDRVARADQDVGQLPNLTDYHSRSESAQPVHGAVPADQRNRLRVSPDDGVVLDLHDAAPIAARAPSGATDRPGDTPGLLTEGRGRCSVWPWSSSSRTRVGPVPPWSQAGKRPGVSLRAS
jgi:hypothetical protein